MSSLSALVSSGGRLFYILDEGSTASIFLPSRWALIARDAFNGKILWKRSIDDWYARFKGLKDGPADAPRRLVAFENRVYATLRLDGPVAALDAVTGETVCTYRGTEGAEEILLSDGVLLVLIGPGSIGDGGRLTRPTEHRTIRAHKADSGNRLWENSDVAAAATLTVDQKHVYYFNFDRKTSSLAMTRRMLGRSSAARVEWGRAARQDTTMVMCFMTSCYIGDCLVGQRDGPRECLEEYPGRPAQRASGRARPKAGL